MLNPLTVNNRAQFVDSDNLPMHVTPSRCCRKTRVKFYGPPNFMGDLNSFNTGHAQLLTELWNSSSSLFSVDFQISRLSVDFFIK